MDRLTALVVLHAISAAGKGSVDMGAVPCEVVTHDPRFVLSRISAPTCSLFQTFDRLVKGPTLRTLSFTLFLLYHGWKLFQLNSHTWYDLLGSAEQVLQWLWRRPGLSG